jgi:hypothetical protein
MYLYNPQLPKHPELSREYRFNQKHLKSGGKCSTSSPALKMVTQKISRGNQCMDNSTDKFERKKSPWWRNIEFNNNISPQTKHSIRANIRRTS